MAKPEKGKIKIRFFEVELEGSDETLLESVRSAAALANRGQPARPAKLITAGITPNGPAAVVEEAVVTEDGAGNGAEGQTIEEPAQARSKSTRAYYRNPKVLNIDLISGPISFADFVASKKPSTTMDHYLVIAAWLKEHRKTPQIGADHIFTCYRALGKSVQKDISQPFRIGKSSTYGYFDNPARGKFEINHIGIGVVGQMGKTKPVKP